MKPVSLLPMDLLCLSISPLQYTILQFYGRIKRINDLDIHVDEVGSLQSFLITPLLGSQHFSEYPPAISYRKSL